MCQMCKTMMSDEILLDRYSVEEGVRKLVKFLGVCFPRVRSSVLTKDVNTPKPSWCASKSHDEHFACSPPRTLYEWPDRIPRRNGTMRCVLRRYITKGGETTNHPPLSIHLIIPASSMGNIDSLLGNNRKRSQLWYRNTHLDFLREIETKVDIEKQC